MTTDVETFQFQAETKQLLDLMIHSLYTTKDIFLRELISNASDALDRLRFEALTTPDVLDSDEQLTIRLDFDSEARTLTISDNGIGMSRDEVVTNIGTIARSGTREIRERLEAGQSPEALAEFIGQFGVGFYSAFMVADQVTLVTRRAGETGATRWESRGDGTYRIAEATQTRRGTTITLHLKPVDADSGIENYTDKWVLSRIVKRYSDFVNYPIVHQDEREEVETDEQGNPKPDGQKTTIIEDKVLNSMKPIWTRSQSEVTDEEYAEFYRHISHDWTEPMKTIVLRAEGRLEYQSLLFIPATASFDLFYQGSEPAIRLYAKRVMITERSPDLLPHYLRFVKGVVDSSDLPLNISRQMLQQDRHITQIRKWLTRKLLDTFKDMFDKEHDQYLQLWEQFGRALKEGVSEDYENKDRLLPLLLFESSHDPEKKTTLADYVTRMKTDQEHIYYLTGESRAIVENSPHLEVFKEKDYEVLYLIDPVDELLVQSLNEFEGKRLKSIGKGTVTLGDEEEREQMKQELEEKQQTYQDLLTFIQQHLDTHVKNVRLSGRLSSSPVCLVGEEHDYSPQLERLLQKGKGGGLPQRRVMELNPSHHILQKMHERFQQNKEDARLSDYADLLFGYALLAEGSDIPDPVRFNRLVAQLMTETL